MSQRRRQKDRRFDREPGILRCVLDDAGRFVFISPPLGWALETEAEKLIGTLAAEVMDVLTPNATPGTTCESGFYDVALKRRARDPLVLPTRIDQVNRPAGLPLTVIWLDPDDTLKDTPADDIMRSAAEFVTLIDNTQKPDITAISAKKAPAAIPDTDSELRHFLNLTNELLVVCRRDLSFARVNSSFNQATGMTDQELAVYSFTDLVHAEDRPDAVRMLKTLTASAPSMEIYEDIECRLLSASGKIRRIAWRLKAVGGYLYILGHDVTNIRQHEADLRWRGKQLSEAQKIGHMGHWYWNLEQDTLECSDQIYNILDIKKAGSSMPMDTFRNFLLKRDLSRVNKIMAAAIQEKKDSEFIFRIRRPDGAIRHLRCEGRCRIDSRTKEVTAVFGIMQDVTERTLYEAALKKAKEEAESAYASRGQFLANMSHELRTPLNAIIGFSEMIQRQLLGPVGNARYLDYVGGIRESGEHLLDLINDILDMSKIEVGKYELYAEDINVGKVIRLAVHMIEGRAHEGQIRLITDHIPENIHITADRRALMQIMLNLLSNAVKFTKPGGQIDIQCRHDLSGVAINISDTGIGIPQEKIDLVTQPFEQVDSELTRGHEGSGLGLAITKSLVELHGGSLFIDSDVDVGTTVTVLLPEKPLQIKTGD